MDWTRLGPEHAVTPIGMFAGAMLIFFKHEGFELIANVSRDVANPNSSLPIAFIGGVLLVIVIYVLIVVVVIGHLSFAGWPHRATRRSRPLGTASSAHPAAC